MVKNGIKLGLLVQTGGSSWLVRLDKQIELQSVAAAPHHARKHRN
jgi:hypothetical protein